MRGRRNCGFESFPLTKTNIGFSKKKKIVLLLESTYFTENDENL